MSNSDRLLLILHIGFAIFTLGPLTAATMATPRYIRTRNVAVLRYLHRATRVYALASLGIFLFGLLLAKGEFAKVWLTASMTLFLVALVLLVLVARDQGRAVHALERAGGGPEPAAPPATSPAPTAPASTPPPAGTEAPSEAGAPGTPGAAPGPGGAATRAGTGIAEVERGRIAALSGVIALLWLVILFLMVWYGR